MFNTIKSKIILIAVLMLISLSILLSLFSYLYLKSGKNLIIKGCSYSIEVFAKNINKEIVKIENNAKDLALQGEMFYNIDKNRYIAETTIIKLFGNYPESLGGGIWFEPYLLLPESKLFCIYAFRNKANQVVIDNQFETEEYDYPNKGWYVEIKPQLEKGEPVAWSLPYYEKEGSNTLMVTAGSGIFHDGKFIGMSTVDWEISSIIKSVSQMKPTQNSFALFADRKQDCIIALNDPYLENSKLLGKSLSEIPWYNENLKQITYFTYHNTKYIPYVKTLDNGMILIVNIPKREIFAVLFKHVAVLFAGLMLMSMLISAMLYAGLQKYINVPIKKLSDIAKKISQGDLDTEIKIEKPEEFAKLAEVFHKMSEDIQTISQERERIESELSLAKEIQLSSLPNVFPPFPERSEFGVFAGMEPAKEVGGDFYDFYFINENQFMFLIADVSGKGVPAALFMMTVKTLINYISQSGLSPEEMIENVNRKICANNKQGFFVTLLTGIVDISSGKLTFINCGHNPPMIKRAGSFYEYVNLDSNIVLGAFEDATFKVNEFGLKPGDTLLLYTDGITEAINGADEFYGEQRFLEVVNKKATANIKALHEHVRNDVKAFTDGVPQSDDMTMLTFKYRGPVPSNTHIYEGVANKENYKHFSLWLNTLLDKLEVKRALAAKITLAAEELYTNIFSYGYPERSGEIEVNLVSGAGKLTLKFLDKGIQYNPLERPDFDITTPPEERGEGGLGIFIVKQSSDEISYEYKDGQNILTVCFNLY